MSVLPACMYACIYIVFIEVRKGHWVPWDWNYRWLSARATSALSH